MNSQLNVIDLFCGCGGMSKGLNDAGLNIIAGVDYWDKAIENYSKNFNPILELKRIQTFPDDYIIEGSKKDII